MLQPSLALTLRGTVERKLAASSAETLGRYWVALLGGICAACDITADTRYHA